MTATYSALYGDTYDAQVHTPAVTATVHAPDGAHIADLPRLLDWRWTTKLRPLGSGQVTISADDPRATDDVVVDGNIVALRVGGVPVAGFVVETPDEAGVADGPGQLTLRGDDVLALLAQVTVHPERGLLRHEPQKRALNWTAAKWVEWAHGPQWAAPTLHGTLSAPANPTWQALWDEIAEKVPLLADVAWQWAGAPLGGGAPAYIYSPMSSWHRFTLTLAADTLCRVYGTCDDEALAVVDGVEHVRSQGPGQWRRLFASSKDIWLGPGDHQVAGRGTNIVRPGGTWAPASAAGFAMAICRIEDGEPVEVLAKTGDPGWLSVGGVDVDPPGMTPGRSIGGVLLPEGQARGCVPGVVADFDDEAATPRPGQALGEQWLQNEDRVVDVGRTLLDVVTAIASSTVDVAMALVPSGRDVTPTLRLWGHGRRTRDLTTGDAPVVLRPGRDIEMMPISHPGEVVNALAVDTPDGWVEVIDQASIDVHGRREAVYAAGEHDTPDAAVAQAQADLAERAWPSQVATVVVLDHPAVRPHEQYAEGDVILASVRRGSPDVQAWQVLTISGSRAGDRIRWTLELGPPPS